MDTFTMVELSRLMGVSHAPCVSLYMPTHVAGGDGQQDPVRLKNLLQRAEEELVATGMRAPEARRLLQAARDLPVDPVFWDARSHGLAVFVSPEGFEAYRLPVRFEELVLVNRRFQIKPLLRYLGADERFLILTLSQNRVRLFAGSRWDLEEVHVPNMPASMKEALNIADADPGLQTHSAARGDHGKQSAVFHGQGGQSDTHKEELVQYFRLVDAALRPVLRGETRPLLLAGAQYLLPMFRKISGYPHLTEEELVGNWDYMTPHQIHQKAVEALEPRFGASASAALSQYHELAGKSRTSHDLRQIVAAADQGRVEALFLDARATQWGRYVPERDEVVLHGNREPEDDDLLDLAVVRTLANRGSVYAVDPQEVPTGASAAALLRY